MFPSPTPTLASFGEEYSYRKDFAQLNEDTRGLLQFGFNVLPEWNNGECPKNPFNEHETRRVYDLISEIQSNIKRMKSISSDLNMLQNMSNLSPHMTAEAKAFAETVTSLQSSIYKLRMEFHQIVHSAERADLFSLSRSPFDDDRSRSRIGKARDISSGVTDSLLHSRKVLLETLARSAETLEQLDVSSNDINDNDEDIMEQSNAVGISKKLSGKYGRREWTDNLLICLALAFFFACVVYIITKRI